MAWEIRQKQKRVGEKRGEATFGGTVGGERVRGKGVGSGGRCWVWPGWKRI